MRSQSKSDSILAIFFMLPAVLFFAGLHLYPITRAVSFSFQERHILDPTGTFVGLKTYVDTLTDPTFWHSLRVTILFVGGALILQLLVGLGLALLMNTKLKGVSIARGLTILPYLVAVIVATTTFRFMFNTLYGIVNHILLKLGVVSQPVAWLTTPVGAFISIISVTFWRHFPFVFLLLLARLQTVPLELYEVARLDGANRFQLFRYVTWPMVLPVVMIVLLLRTIWTFNKFEEIYLLTWGGPGNATSTIPIYTYLKAFVDYQLGKGSAIALLGFCFLLIFVVIYVIFYFKTEEKIQ